MSKNSHSYRLLLLYYSILLTVFLGWYFLNGLIRDKEGIEPDDEYSKLTKATEVMKETAEIRLKTAEIERDTAKSRKEK